MKILNKSRALFVRCLLGLTIGICGIPLHSCKEDKIEVNAIDKSKYAIDPNTFAYLVDAEGKTQLSLVEVDEQKSINLALQLTKNATEKVTAKLQYDASLVENYNTKNGTNLIPLAPELVKFDNNGDLEVTTGKDKSSFVKIGVTVNSSVDKSKTYVIPVSTKIIGGKANASTTVGHFLIQIKNVSGKPSTNKKSGMKLISIIEVNDTNPLVHTSFKLKDEDKPLFDVVVLFSANINYDAKKQKPYVFFNENVQHLLDNHVKYIKPLQDQGTKVILSILGNHDRAGVANLSPQSAKLFAQELKAICTAYQLDGIMLDDEYSKYEYPAPAGFVNPSNQAVARLYYEIKQAMPDKINLVYAYSSTDDFSGNNAIPEASAGDYIDIVVNDYFSDVGLDRFPGVKIENYAINSEEYARGSFLYYWGEGGFKSIFDSGIRSHMIFALDQTRSNFSSQLADLKMMTTVFFKDELAYDGVVHRKDW